MSETDRQSPSELPREQPYADESISLSSSYGTNQLHLPNAALNISAGFTVPSQASSSAKTPPATQQSTSSPPQVVDVDKQCQSIRDELFELVTSARNCGGYLVLIGPKLAGMTVTLNYCLRHWEEQWDVDIPLENNSNLGHLVLSKKKILLRIALARENNAKTSLLSLPKEIKLMIWEYAVTEDEPIKPTRVGAVFDKFCPYGTFLHGQLSIPPVAHQLVATQLSRVCVEAYKMCTESLLLYKLNSFHPQNINYLFYIAPLRLETIRSITIDVSKFPTKVHDQLNVLAYCSGLKELRLQLKPVRDDPFYQALGLGREQVKATYLMMVCLIRAVKGLDRLDIIGHKTQFTVTRSSSTTIPEVPSYATFFKQMTAILQPRMKQDRKITSFYIRRFEQVRELYHIDACTRRTGDVASRTREAKHRHQNTEYYGALQYPKPGKYDNPNPLVEDPPLSFEEGEEAVSSLYEYIDSGDEDDIDDNEPIPDPHGVKVSFKEEAKDLIGIDEVMDIVADADQPWNFRKKYGALRAASGVPKDEHPSFITKLDDEASAALAASSIRDAIMQMRSVHRGSDLQSDTTRE